jgi:hypothetical protein
VYYIIIRNIRDKNQINQIYKKNVYYIIITIITHYKKGILDILDTYKKRNLTNLTTIKKEF